MSATTLTFRHTATLFTSQRKLWVPFLVTAWVEALCLLLIWLAPHPPFSTLLAPPLRYAFGDRILHYPWHPGFLYQAMQHTQVAASVIAGAFMSGVACAMVAQTYAGKPLSLREALVSRHVRYGTVLTLWVIAWVLARGLVAAVPALAPAGWALWGGIGATVLLQTLVVYAIPVAVFERATWWKALVRGLRETARYPLSTLSVILVPSAAVIAYAVLASPARVAQWTQMTPELAVGFVVGRLVVWTVADAVMMVAIAHLWWVHRAPGRAPTRAVVSPNRIFPAAGVALSVFAGLAALGVFVTGRDVSYNGERLFWHAQRINAPIVKDAGRASAEQFTAALAAFDRVIQQAPGTEWTARAYLAVGSLYALQRQYDRARDAYSALLRDHSQQRELCLTARVATAKTYEREARWDDATRVYRDLAESYPWAKIGLEAPLHIATLYERQGQLEQAAEARERAVLMYRKAIAHAPTPETEAEARGYLALAHHQLGDWDAAVKALEELAAMPSGVNQPLVLLSLGSLYQARPGHEHEASQVLAKLASEFPDHPYAAAAKTRLQHLGLQFVAQHPSASTTANQTPN